MLQHLSRFGAVLLVALLASTAHAGPPPEPRLRVFDLAPGAQERSAWPYGFVPFGDRVLFLARDTQHGDELWSSDGTARGTGLVLDACPGPCSAYPLGPVVAGDRYFFVVPEAPGLHALWVGDASGVRRVFLTPPSEYTSIDYLTAIGDRIVFAPSDPEHGIEPWVSDGTPEGTRLLANLCEMECSSYPSEFRAVGDVAFFRAVHRDLGDELFVTDGTPEGTHLVADLCPFGCASSPSPLVTWQGRLWFTAWRPDLGSELWSVAPGGEPRLEADLRPGPEEWGLFSAFVWQDRLYLEAFLARGLRWWRISEPGEAPRRAVELPVRSGGFTVVGEALYFVQAGRDGSGLWVLDDPSAPARLLASLEGPAAPLGALGGSLFYRQSLPGEDALWRTDGTIEGTQEIRRFDSLHWPPGGTAGGRLLFAADGGGAGVELWSVTAAGAPERVRNLTYDAASSEPHRLTAWGEDLAFLAGGRQLPSLRGSVWRARGGEVTRLTDEDDFFDLVRLGDSVVAVRETGVGWLETGELWRVDAGGARTLLYDGPSPMELTVAGSRLFFGTLGSGQALWTSDGTPEGTRIVVDADPTWSDECLAPCDPVSYPRAFTALGDRVAFVAAPQGRKAVWVSDGTPEGTAPLAGGEPFDQGGPQSFGYLTAVGDTLLFVGFHRSEEAFLSIRFLYRWRPGLSVPERVAELSLSDLAPMRLAAAGGRLFFVQQTPEDGGDELWVVGPRGPARRVDGLRSSELPRAIRALEPFGDRVLVSALDLLTGDEPWVSGGRPLATVPLGDLAPGSASSRATGLAPVGDCALFAAAGAGPGHELWLTDGTAEGTRLVIDLARGARASSPAEITTIGDWVYFTADDGRHGRELFAIERATVDDLCSEPPPAP